GKSRKGCGIGNEHHLAVQTEEIPHRQQAVLVRRVVCRPDPASALQVSNTEQDLAWRREEGAPQTVERTLGPAGNPDRDDQRHNKPQACDRPGDQPSTPTGTRETGWDEAVLATRSDEEIWRIPWLTL